MYTRKNASEEASKTASAKRPASPRSSAAVKAAPGEEELARRAAARKRAAAKRKAKERQRQKRIFLMAAGLFLSALAVKDITLSEEAFCFIFSCTRRQRAP